MAVLLHVTDGGEFDVSVPSGHVFVVELLTHLHASEEERGWDHTGVTVLRKMVHECSVNVWVKGLGNQVVVVEVILGLAVYYLVKVFNERNSCSFRQLLGLSFEVWCLNGLSWSLAIWDRRLLASEDSGSEWLWEATSWHTNPSVHEI